MESYGLMQRPLVKDAGLRTQRGKLQLNPRIESLKYIACYCNGVRPKSTGLGRD